MSTANKNLNIPTNNTYINSWDIPVNTNFNGIDYALCGITYASVTGQSGDKTMIGTYSSTYPYPPDGVGSFASPVTSSPSYIPSSLFITGTATADVNYLLPAGIKGQWLIYNGSTGSGTVSFGISGGATISIEQGKNRLLFSDGVNILQVTSGSSEAQGSLNSLQFNYEGVFGGAALKYTPSSGNFTLGPLSFDGAIDGSGVLSTTGNQPLSVGMIIKKVSDNSTVGTVDSGSGSSFTLTSYTVTSSTQLYASPATGSADDSLVINGYDNKYAAYLKGGSTSGQSYGVKVKAGSASGDNPVIIQDKDGNELLNIDGLGSVDITSRPSSNNFALNIVKPSDTGNGALKLNGSVYTVVETISYSNPMTLDASKSNIFKTTLTGDVSTLTINNAQEGQTINFVITQDGTGNRYITWPASFKFANGIPNTWMSVGAPANSTSMLVATYINGYFYCTLVTGF